MDAKTSLKTCQLLETVRLMTCVFGSLERKQTFSIVYNTVNIILVDLAYKIH